jgi:GH35 family endo-1,4-beta-xylanase
MAERDARIADIYRDLLMVLISEPAVEGIVQWGLGVWSDRPRYTWLNPVASRRVQSLQRPLPFDHPLQAKLACGSICAVLSSGPNLFDPN